MMVLRKAETIVANFMFFVFNSLSFCLILIQNYGKFMAVPVYMVSTNYLSTKTIIWKDLFYLLTDKVTNNVIITLVFNK